MFLVICYVSKRKIMYLVNLTSELFQGQLLLIALCVCVCVCVNHTFLPLWTSHNVFLENWIFYFVLFFVFFRAAPAAYGSSQARGIIRATAAGLCHSHSNSGSEPCLRSTPQLTAMPHP